MDLQNPIFTDDDKAREALEAVRWPNGPVCPHCGSVGDDIAKVEGKKQTHRPGLYYCNACEGQFTVTVGTVFERSKISLSKWWLAVHLINSSKKGYSAHQLHRTLGVTYKTAWFMAHRIREAMRTGGLAPMGGSGKVVEIDETMTGKQEGAPKRTYQGYGQQWRNRVLALVERGGNVRTFHVTGTSTAELVPIIRANIQTETFVMTDEARWYGSLSQSFAGHEAVNHTNKEYVRREFTFPEGKLHTLTITTNTVEGYFSIFKRGMKGIYQHCSEKHLHRYLAEFDFRYNYRVALGYNDGERAALAMKGIEGKRLTYRPTSRPRPQESGAQVS
jgi:transposase-like protein